MDPQRCSGAQIINTSSMPSRGQRSFFPGTLIWRQSNLGTDCHAHCKIRKAYINQTIYQPCQSFSTHFRWPLRRDATHFASGSINRYYLQMEEWQTAGFTVTSMIASPTGWRSPKYALGYFLQIFSAFTPRETTFIDGWMFINSPNVLVCTPVHHFWERRRIVCFLARENVKRTLFLLAGEWHWIIMIQPVALKMTRPPTWAGPLVGGISQYHEPMLTDEMQSGSQNSLSDDHSWGNLLFGCSSGNYRNDTGTIERLNTGAIRCLLSCSQCVINVLIFCWQSKTIIISSFALHAFYWRHGEFIVVISWLYLGMGLLAPDISTANARAHQVKTDYQQNLCKSRYSDVNSCSESAWLKSASDLLSRSTASTPDMTCGLTKGLISGGWMMYAVTQITIKEASGVVRLLILKSTDRSKTDSPGQASISCGTIAQL